MNFTILVESSMLIYYNHASNLTALMSRSKEEDYLKIALILMFLAPPLSPQRGRGHEFHNCYSPSPIDLVEIGSMVSEKKLKCSKVYEQRRTAKDSNRSPEWLRWPKKQWNNLWHSFVWNLSDYVRVWGKAPMGKASF